MLRGKSNDVDYATLQQNYTNLQQKFDTLTRLRSTDAEAQLHAFEASMKLQLDAARQRIEALEQQLKSGATETESNETNALMETLRMYETLTGLKIRRDQKQSDMYHCIQRGRRGEMEFALTLVDEDTIAYDPVADRIQRPATATLPAHAHQGFDFRRRQAPLFYYAVCDDAQQKP